MEMNTVAQSFDTPNGIVEFLCHLLIFMELGGCLINNLIIHVIILLQFIDLLLAYCDKPNSGSYVCKTGNAS